MSCNTSSITVSASKARELAQAKLDSIMAVRERLRKEWAEEHQKSWFVRFWAWVNRRPVPTVDEIWRAWDKYKDWRAYEIHLQGWGSEAVAKRILKAAQYAEEVTISAEDLELL